MDTPLDDRTTIVVSESVYSSADSDVYTVIMHAKRILGDSGLDILRKNKLWWVSTMNMLVYDFAITFKYNDATLTIHKPTRSMFTDKWYAESGETLAAWLLMQE